MSDEPSPSREEDARDESGETGDGDASASESEEHEGRRPISVRDLMPPSAADSPRRAPERRRRSGQPGEPSPVRDDEEDEDPSPSRPTPVRVAMDAPPPGDSRPARELPSRRFEVEGEEWVVRITGRTVTGTRPDPGAPLMHLTFYRAARPDEPERELLTVERPLDALYVEDLAEFLERSRSAHEPFAEESRGGQET